MGNSLRPQSCPKCFSPIQLSAAFCSQCGFSLGTTPAPVRQALDKTRFQKTWAHFKNIAFLYGIILGTSLVFGIASHFTTDPKLEIIESVLDAVVITIFCWIYRRQLAPAFRLRHPLKSLYLIPASGIFIWIFIEVYFALLAMMGGKPLNIVKPFLDAKYPVWSIYLIISVMPAIFEELAFRGVIYSALNRFLSRRESVVIQAALFSVLHLLPMIFVSHFTMGLVFGFLRATTRSIYPSMILHGAWNAFVVWKVMATS